MNDLIAAMNDGLRRQRIRRDALREIGNERRRQDLLWLPVERRPDVSAEHRLAILAEEFGEYAAAANEGDIDAQRTELVQVAACALAAIELIDTQREISHG